MVRRTRRYVMAGAAAAASLALAACSSSGSAGSTAATSAATSSGSPAASSAAALTGDPVVFGVITDASGATGDNPSMQDTATRWVAYTNSHGGINGRPVKVIVMDTQDNAATALQDAQTLVQQDKVVAIGDDSYLNSAYEKYLDSEKIPAISMSSGFVTFTYVSDPNFFSPTVNVLTDLWGLTKSAALLGNHKFGTLYCAEIAACGQITPIMKANAESVGMTQPYAAGFSASAPSYTAQCLAAKAAGVDALLAGGSVVEANKRVYDDCAQQGYKPLAVLAVCCSTPEIFNDPQIPLASSVIGVQPWFEDNGPTYAAFHAVMDSYLEQPSVEPFLVVNHWVGLEMFKTAAEAAPAGAAVTTADVYKGLYAMKDETLGGAVPPFTITKGKPGSANCLYVYQSANGHLSTLNGGQPVCQTA
jgi:branched-chain amino acid transport system substrate-binding protein